MKVYMVSAIHVFISLLRSFIHRAEELNNALPILWESSSLHAGEESGEWCGWERKSDRAPASLCVLWRGDLRSRRYLWELLKKAILLKSLRHYVMSLWNGIKALSLLPSVIQIALHLSHILKAQEPRTARCRGMVLSATVKERCHRHWIPSRWFYHWKVWYDAHLTQNAF